MTREHVLQVLTALSEGNALGSISKGMCGVPSFAFAELHEALAKDDDLMGRYVAAQRTKAELMADETVAIADTDPDPARARIRVEARRWYASKLAPQKYGDRIELVETERVDLRRIVALRLARLAQVGDPAATTPLPAPDSSHVHVESASIAAALPADTIPAPPPYPAPPDPEDDDNVDIFG